MAEEEKEVKEEKTYTLKAEFPKEDPSFLTDDVFVPEGLAEMMDNFVYTALLIQPEGGFQSLTRFARNYFTDLHAIFHDSQCSIPIYEEGEEEGEEEDEHSHHSFVSVENENRAPKNTNGNTNKTEENDERQTVRRCAISSSAYDPRFSTTRTTKFQKTPAQMQRLTAEAADILPLKHLEGPTLKKALEALKPINVKGGTFICREGEEGEDFYIIESGTFNIYKKKGPEDETVGELISTLNGSGSFGELALMYHWPRQATVKAMTDGSLWMMDHKVYQQVGMDSAFRLRRQLEENISKVDLMKQLQSGEIADLCDVINVKEVGPNDIIIKEGDEASSMFFVLEGEVVVVVGGKEVNRLSAGGYFGEMALMTKEKRSATVKAAGHVVLGELGVDAFERILGPCKELMRRKQDTYKK